MANSDDKMLEVFKETDAMYTGGRSPEALAILRKYSQLENAEVLWRLVRACSTVGMHFTKDQAEAKRLAGEAMDFGKRAIAADAGNYNAHRVKAAPLSSSPPPPPPPTFPLCFIYYYFIPVINDDLCALAQSLSQWYRCMHIVYMPINNQTYSAGKLRAQRSSME